MNKTFDYGIIWEPGAGGNFLTSRLLKNPADYVYLEHINEYMCGDIVYKVRPTVRPARAEQKILNSHQLPTEFFRSVETVHVKQLLCLAPHWFPFLLLQAKRLFNYPLKPSETTWMVQECMRFPNPSIRYHPGKIQDLCDDIHQQHDFSVQCDQHQWIACGVYIFISWCHGNNLEVDAKHFGKFLEIYVFNETMRFRNQVKTKTYKFLKAVEELSRSGQVDKIIVGDYEELFFDLHVPWHIGTKPVAEYSLRNMGLLTKMTNALPVESRNLWEKFVSSQTTRILNRLNQ